MGDFVPELIFFGFTLGVDLIICGCLNKAINTTNNLIRDLTSSPQISIDEEMQIRIQKHPSCVSDEATNTQTIPYAIIRGDVTPMAKALSSNYATDLMGVIQKVAFTEHKRKLNEKARWVDSKNAIAQYTNETPFSLTGLQPPQYFVFEEPWRFQLDIWSKNLNPTWDSISVIKRPHVEVSNWSSATRIDLDTVFDQFENDGAGKFGKYIMGSIVGDIRKGVQTTEKMLTKGTALTGIGELVSGPQGVTLQPPSDGRPYYLVKNSLSSLIKEMEGSRAVNKIFLKIFLGVGVIISGAAIYTAIWKVYKKMKADKEARVNQDTLDSIRAERSNTTSRESGGNIPESIQCVVCLGAEREVILLDCGHVCVCADCAGQLIRDSHSCPVCRAIIVRVMPAYVS